MKKSWFLAIIMAISFSFSFTSCDNKSEYKNPEKALYYLYDNLQESGVNISLNNCVMYVSSSTNFNYSTRGFEVLSIQLTDGDSLIHQFSVENTPNGWMIEKNSEFFSKNGIDNLRPLTMEEEKYIKLAYEKIINM